jgi:hypothetical protein
MVKHSNGGLERDKEMMGARKEVRQRVGWPFAEHLPEERRRRSLSLHFVTPCERAHQDNSNPANAARRLAGAPPPWPG